MDRLRTCCTVVLGTVCSNTLKRSFNLRNLKGNSSLYRNCIVFHFNSIFLLELSHPRHLFISIVIRRPLGNRKGSFLHLFQYYSERKKIFDTLRDYTGHCVSKHLLCLFAPFPISNWIPSRRTVAYENAINKSSDF